MTHEFSARFPLSTDYRASLCCRNTYARVSEPDIAIEHVWAAKGSRPGRRPLLAESYMTAAVFTSRRSRYIQWWRKILQSVP
jgi:hypothetical protein